MKLYTDFLIPAANFLRDVSMHGMIYDVNAALDLFELDLRPERNALTQEMRELVGKPLMNPGSPVQIAALIYDEWRITHVMQQRPDKQRSVDSSARDEILNGRFTHASTVDADVILLFVQKLHRYARLKKQMDTYIVGLIKAAIQDPDHRVYTNLNLHTTVTGRLSSTDPNLQNITRSVDDLPNIRNLFKAPQGRMMVQADYSQAELRVIAHLSGDQELLRIYRDGLDLHSEVATMFHGPNYTSEQRTHCKSMNFGVAYRQSAKTFQEKHGIPQKEGQQFIDWWWQRFKAVARWETDIERRIHADGVLISPFGRRRRFHLLTDENRQSAYREGINFYPQSTASDFTLVAGMRAQEELDSKRANICLLVHDAINAEVDEDYVDEASMILVDVMAETPRSVLAWDTPFTADVGAGATWGTAK
jgi:DNA polymerase I